MGKETFTTTAVVDPLGHFKHFRIMKSISSIYGVKPEEVITVDMQIHDDQTLPTDNGPEGQDYWGWFDEETGMFTMVYAQYFLLNMCFPYGIESAEAAGEGKAYRLNVTIKR